MLKFLPNLALALIFSAATTFAEPSWEKMVVTPDFEKAIPFAADGDPWSFQANVQPGFVPGKGEVRLDFVDEQQTGVRVRIAPRGGGPSLVRLVGGQVDEHAPMERNPIMNLAEGDYNYRLPFDLRVLSGDGKVQLYLGFLGMAPELIQYELLADVTNCTQLIISSVDATMTISNGETAPLDVPIPDLTARPPVGDAMPRWSEFSGVHYIPRAPFRLYRGLFYDPVIYRVIASPEDAPEAEYRPWVTYVSKSQLPEDCVEKIGPFSGQTIQLRESRIREALAWAKEHDAFLIQGRDVQKRTDYYDPAEVTLRKDEVYWSVRAFYEAADSADIPVFFQLGNEINAFHVPWKNHPDLIRRYVEYNFAPAAEAIRQVSTDLFGAPDRIPLMLGSVASPWPLGMGWLQKMVDTTIEGDSAPTLTGKKVWEVADRAAIHYALKGPFWAQYLDSTYDHLLKDDRLEGFWSTEEIGGNADLAKGPFYAAITFRYMDWWSRHNWRPQRGGFIVWGDTRGKSSYTTAMDVQSLIGDFLGDRELTNVTDTIQAEGDPDLETYAFATKSGTPGVAIAILSRKYVFYPDNEAKRTLRLKDFSVKIPNTQPDQILRGSVHQVSDQKIHTVLSGDIPLGPDARLTIPGPLELDRSKQEIFLAFYGATDSPSQQPWGHSEPEPSRVVGTDEIFSLHLGNDLAVGLGDESAWHMLAGGVEGETDGTKRKNIDAGMAGDHHGLTLDRRNSQEIEFPITVTRDASSASAPQIIFEMVGAPVEVLWDGKPIAKKVTSGRPIPIPEAVMPNLSAGLHQITLRNNPGESTTVDALILQTE